MGKSKLQEEFDIAWQEFFKNKPKPKSDAEEKKQLEDFTHWYNNVRKQSGTGKTPVEMYKEIYGKTPLKPVLDTSRMVNFEWDEDYDEELIILIEELKEYDNEKGYRLNYETVKEKLKSTINKIIEKNEKALNYLHPLLENEETWSCLFSLEILKGINSKKSIPYLLEFIEKNENGEYFESCDAAMLVLINIGAQAAEEIILHIEKGLEEQIYHGYLFEALSKIKSQKGKDLRLKLLKDYLNNSGKYKSWFDLTMFLCDFNEDEKEALPFLKQLNKMNLDREEKRELESTIEVIEDSEGYENKLSILAEEIKPLFEKMKKKIGRNEPCLCGSGKKYKKCCLKGESKISSE